MKTHRSTLLAIASLLFLLQSSNPAGKVERLNLDRSALGEAKISPRLQGELSADKERSVHKIWVYFNDKGMTRESLIKALNEVRLNMKPRCLWRRAKVRDWEDVVDHEDIPVCPAYTQKIGEMTLKVRTVSRWLNAVSVEATPRQVRSIAELDFVRSVDRVTCFSREEGIPTPTYKPHPGESAGSGVILYGNSFIQLNQINVIPLHELGYSGKGVLVCLLDTGFRKSHEVFRSSRLVAEWDFVNGDGDVQQDFTDPDDYSDSHGTGTWSVLGGYKPGELVGPAYGADFLLAKTETTNFEEPIEEDYWVAGIEWAEALGAEVVSSSLGYTDWYEFKDMDGRTAVTTRAANRATSLGVVVVNAVGNERGSSWGHLIAPSDGYDVLAVGAVDSSGNLASFSSPGPSYDGRIKPEVCAMGVNTWVAANRSDGSDYFRSGSGTSFATPLVGGVVALLLEAHRDWTPQDVRSALLATSSLHSNPNNDYGWGIVNAALASRLEMTSLEFEGFLVDDDTSGNSFGNGNGIPEPGETLEISVTLRNQGQIPAVNVIGTLSTLHPDFNILVSRVSFPSIPASESRVANGSFAVRIPAFFPGRHVLFRLNVEGSQVFRLEEVLRLTVSR